MMLNYVDTLGTMLEYGIRGAGGLLAWYCGREMWRGFSSSSWSNADGKVTESRVEQSASISTDSRTGAQYNVVFYSAALTYEYTVEREAYVGHAVTVSADIATSSRLDASAVVERYPAGREVRVYYKPGQPASSCLEVGVVGWMNGVLMLIGLGWCLLPFARMIRVAVMR